MGNREFGEPRVWGTESLRKREAEEEESVHISEVSLFQRLFACKNCRMEVNIGNDIFNHTNELTRYKMLACSICASSNSPGHSD